MPRIAIIGLGIIGGSLGLALEEALGPRIEIVGHDRDAVALAQAQERGAVDRHAASPQGAVRDTSLVVIATPVLAIRQVLADIAPHLSPTTLVTDTGSTKAQVLGWARDLLPTPSLFVGGHPMAGKETPGITAADPELFHSRLYCLTPADDTDPRALVAVSALATAAGAHPHTLTPDLHDCYVAAVSHLPALLSAALVSTASGDPAWPQMSQLAATGFRDTTRLASGDPVMWRDICATNARPIVKWLGRLGDELQSLRQLVQDSQEGGGQLQRRLADARQARDRWLDDFQRRAPPPDRDEAAQRLLALLTSHSP